MGGSKQRRGRIVGVPITLSVLLLAALASSAQATTFDSVHEPPPIGSSGVTATTSGNPGGREDPRRFESFKVSIDVSLTCPAGEPRAYTVVFADPTGSKSIPLLDPCAGTWRRLPDPNGLDFHTSLGQGEREFGLNPSVAFVPDYDGRTPFLYQVVGPSGIIAQRAMTVTAESAEQIDRRSRVDDYINICLDGRHEIYSKENGDLYCTSGGSISWEAGGWPASKPLPRPKPKRAPEYARLSETNAAFYAKDTVRRYFHYIPKGWRAHCATVHPDLYLCKVSWRHGEDSFSGTVEMGEADATSYAWGLRIVRSNVRTHKRRTFSSPY
jgi:hypothetical protein